MLKWKKIVWTNTDNRHVWVELHRTFFISSLFYVVWGLFGSYSSLDDKMVWNFDFWFVINVQIFFCSHTRYDLLFCNGNICTYRWPFLDMCFAVAYLIFYVRWLSLRLWKCFVTRWSVCLIALWMYIDPRVLLLDPYLADLVMCLLLLISSLVFGQYCFLVRKQGFCVKVWNPCWIAQWISTQDSKVQCQMFA